MTAVAVGFFGMIGALLRYGMDEAIGRWWHGAFPIPTLIVNLLGCFALGWFTARIKARDDIHPYIKTGVSTGMIGSFTTFSAFSVETIQLLEKGAAGLAVLYVLASLLGGVLFVAAGFRSGTSRFGNGGMDP
ncbi:fluoride efflux transporter CrcB [Caenibacillus caldisaponilyticus]|uniref:fluoride efflux transporter CrcB n=1 Tax=Caenibacillus caldisaponilyticus TaxID=1674942 RepID=UPI000988953B|nr:fluoride efflux transporter CrcB [Caenibacillus caldisaponilyticus]